MNNTVKYYQYILTSMSYHIFWFDWRNHYSSVWKKTRLEISTSSFENLLRILKCLQKNIFMTETWNWNFGISRKWFPGNSFQSPCWAASRDVMLLSHKVKLTLLWSESHPPFDCRAGIHHHITDDLGHSPSFGEITALYCSTWLWFSFHPCNSDLMVIVHQEEWNCFKYFTL